MKIVAEFGGIAIAVWVIIELFKRDKDYRLMLENHLTKTAELLGKMCTSIEEMNNAMNAHTKQMQDDHREIRQKLNSVDHQ